MANAWRKTLMYLGLVEDEDLGDYGYDDLAEEEPRQAAPQPVSRRTRTSTLHRVSDAEQAPRRDAVVRAIPSPATQLHVVYPVAMKDVEELGDRYKNGFSVVMNLRETPAQLRQRVFDYACGLVHGIGGSMSKEVAEKTWILTPPGIEVSVEEGRRFLEERGFLGQV